MQKVFRHIEFMAENSLHCAYQAMLYASVQSLPCTHQIFSRLRSGCSILAHECAELAALAADLLCVAERLFHT